MNVRLRWLLTILLAAFALHVAAADKGYVGFSLSADGEGFFLNPTLKTLTITKVTPNSPTASAGIVAGDQIVEIEGHPVAGAKARDLKPYMDREVGQALQLVIKKASGETKPLSLVAAAKP